MTFARLALSLATNRFDFVEERFGQKAKSDISRVSVWMGRSQIWARPDKVIGLRQDDIRRLVVESQSNFCGMRDFNGIFEIGWCRMGDRTDKDPLLIVGDRRRKDDRGRTVLPPSSLPACASRRHRYA